MPEAQTRLQAGTGLNLVATPAVPVGCPEPRPPGGPLLGRRGDPVRPLPTMSGHLGRQDRKAPVPEAAGPLQSACAFRTGTLWRLSRYAGRQTQSTARTKYRATVRRRLRIEADVSSSKRRRD